MISSVGAMARTRNTDKIQKRLKEEERQAKAAAEEKKVAAEEKKAAEENQAAKEKKAAAEEEESAEEEEESEEGEEDAEEEEEMAEEESDAESACGDRSSGGSVSSRKRSASESSEELHYVPSVKKHHKSWASFEAYLKSYERRTNTVLVIAETLNVRLRNERMKKQKR
ncbi:hypothetical protein PF003_g14694 [Phytophthora fragariae]|nr:hypothetical protein PF003_g14694 [Phytophthora fragariae]